MSNGLLFSVLIPLEDVRGDIAAHLGSWTHEQTFPRERFQLVVASDGGDPESERQLASLLEPQDALVRADSSHVVALWREAAAHARAPWLVLTEAHCHADHRCLSATATALVAEPSLDAAMFTHGHVTASMPAELTARWFELMYSQWSQSEWAHLNPVGLAVRRDLFNEIDAFHPRYGLFSAHLLSARLHERGAKVGAVADAVVSHVYHDTLSEHHAHSADSARGECEARRVLDDDFCERYFGRLDAWSDRLRYRPALARHVTRALLSQGRRSIAATRRAAPMASELAWIARELFTWLPSSVNGALPRASWERLDFWVSAWATERLPLPSEMRWKGYLRAQERVVRATRFRWIHEHLATEPSLAPATGRWNARELDQEILIGAHTPEHLEDGWFRWTKPAAVLRLAAPPGRHQLRIDTHGMRGAPLDYLAGVHVAGHPIPSSAIHGDGVELIVDLPGRMGRSCEGIVLLCRPYEPRKDGSPDQRRLGMPIFSIELCPAA